MKEFRVHALRDGDPTECTRLLRLILMGISLEVAEQVNYSFFNYLSFFLSLFQFEIINKFQLISLLDAIKRIRTIIIR